MDPKYSSTSASFYFCNMYTVSPNLCHWIIILWKSVNTNRRNRKLMSQYTRRMYCWTKTGMCPCNSTTTRGRLNCHTILSIQLFYTPATATIAGNPKIVESMVKEHEEHVMDIFRTIDRIANHHGVSCHDQDGDHKLENKIHARVYIGCSTLLLWTV